MANMRYRKPSVKTVLGVTKLKKRVKKALGINKLLWPFRAVNNYKRRMLRQAGYYSPQMKMMRAAKRGQAPGPIGPLQLGERGEDHDAGEPDKDNSALLMAAMLAKGDHGEKGGDENALLMAAMLAKGTQGKAAGKSRQKGGQAGPNLAEAMLLAKAMQGTDEEHTHKAKHADADQVPRTKHAAGQDTSRAAHPRAAHGREQPSAAAEQPEQPAPKRRRGLRFFGLLLMALVEAVAIVSVWYYWVV